MSAQVSHVCGGTSRDSRTGDRGRLSGNLATQGSAQTFAGSVGELAVRHIRRFRVFNKGGTSETHRLCGNRPTYEQVLAFLDEFRKETETEPQKTNERPKAKPQRQTDANDVPPPRPDPRPIGSSSKGERYRSYFQGLIDELREQHDFTGRRTGRAQNGHYFSSGMRGIYYEATFARNHKVYAGLCIDSEDYAENKNFFDVLKERESEITAQFDIPLNWERRDETRYSAIRLIRDGDINADENALAAIKEWHIAYLLKLKAVFTPEIELALEKLKSQPNRT